MITEIKHAGASDDVSKRTYQFLHTLSYHLSGRPSCRKLEYFVCIGVDYHKVPIQLNLAQDSSIEVDMKNRIYFYPEVKVFPDVHTRKKHNLQDVLYHVATKHFYDSVYDGLDEFGRVLMKPDSLVIGVYKYALSFDGRRRRWIKVR